MLGVVRLNEARKHKAISKELSAQLDDQSPKDKREIKKQIQAEKQQYSKIKKLRWTLLTNGEKLTETQHSDMQGILEKHSSLAVCYAMKEELVSLFKLRDPHEAEIGWRKWFKAAKESEIPELVHFAELKERRLNGLIAHAQYPISTGRLEGFNTISYLKDSIIQRRHVMLEMTSLVKEQIVSHRRSTTFSNVANTSLRNPRLRISFQICSMGFISGV